MRKSHTVTAVARKGRVRKSERNIVKSYRAARRTAREVQAYLVEEAY